MEKFKIRKNAYLEGAKAGFVGGIFVTIATALMIQRAKQDFNSRYPFSTPR